MICYMSFITLYITHDTLCYIIMYCIQYILYRVCELRLDARQPPKAETVSFKCH